MNAVGYARISTEDQSNNSLASQRRLITDYCVRHGIKLSAFFEEDGKSGFSFDRPQWMALEAYIKKNRHIDRIVIRHLDRLSRADVVDALIKLKEVEVKLGVKVLTIDQAPDVDNDEFGNKLIRIIGLMKANQERSDIVRRTKDGIRQSLLSGRHCNAAPVGYLNGRDPNDRAKPLIYPCPLRSGYVKQAFEMFAGGATQAEIRRAIPGLKMNGNSAIQRMLSNPLYMGIVTVPGEGGGPAIEVPGLHAPIIEPALFWACQKKLGGKGRRRLGDDDVYLRGILKCKCGYPMTAGLSTGKGGKYWYYVCKRCKLNYNANKVHANFTAVLQHLSLPGEVVEEVGAALAAWVSEYGAGKGGAVMRLKLEQGKLSDKLTAVQKRYLTSTDVDEGVYKQVTGELKADIADIEGRLRAAEADTATMRTLVDRLLPQLSDIASLFERFTLHQKRLFIDIVFPKGLFYYDGASRTPQLIDVLAHNALILKEKGLLFIEQQPVENAILMESTQSGNLVEQLNRLWGVVAG